MREEMKTGSCKGIALEGTTTGQKALSWIMLFAAALVLVVLPRIL